MAIISKGFFLTVTLQDSGLSKTTKEWELRGATLADAVTNANGFLALLNPVTDANVVSYNISQRFVEDAPSIPSSGQVESLAIVSVRTSGGNGATIEVPAPVDLLFDALTGDGQNNVNTAYQPLVDYYGAYLAVGGKVFVSDGESATLLVKGQRGTKKSRQGTRR